MAEIVAEQALVDANRELIARFEMKIQDTLARVWGEAATTTDGTQQMEPACAPASAAQALEA